MFTRPAQILPSRTQINLQPASNKFSLSFFHSTLLASAVAVVEPWTRVLKLLTRAYRAAAAPKDPKQVRVESRRRPERPPRRILKAVDCVEQALDSPASFCPEPPRLLT